MEKLNIKDLNQWIDEQKSEVEQLIIRNRSPEKQIRTRERDKEEQTIIDKLCKMRWEQAEQEGCSY